VSATTSIALANAQSQRLRLGLGTRSPSLCGGATHFLTVAPPVKERRVCGADDPPAINEVLLATAGVLDEQLPAAAGVDEALLAAAEVDELPAMALPAVLVKGPTDKEELAVAVAFTAGVQVDTEVGGFKEGSYWKDEVAGRKCGEGVSCAVPSSLERTL